MALREIDIQLRRLAEESATKWKNQVSLSPEELTELHLLIIKKRPNKKRFTQLHSKLPPLDPKLDTKYWLPFFLTRLRKLKIADIRKEEMKKYLTPEKEEELIKEYFRKGPDSFIIFDLPVPLVQGPIERKIKERVIKILEGKDLEWQLEVNGQMKNSEKD